MRDVTFNSDLGLLTCTMTDRDVNRIKTFWIEDNHFSVRSWTRKPNDSNKVFCRLIGRMTNGNYCKVD